MKWNSEAGVKVLSCRILLQRELWSSNKVRNKEKK